MRFNPYIQLLYQLQLRRLYFQGDLDVQSQEEIVNVINKNLETVNKNLVNTSPLTQDYVKEWKISWLSKVPFCIAYSNVYYHDIKDQRKYRILSSVPIESNMNQQDSLITKQYMKWYQELEGRYVPRPIIQTVDVSAQTTNDTSRNVAIDIKCFSVQQLYEVQKYFTNLGQRIYIQLGWSTLIADLMDIETYDAWLKQDRNKIQQLQLSKSIGEYSSRNSYGNKININVEFTKFSVSMEQNNTYNLKITGMTVGSLILSKSTPHDSSKSQLYVHKEQKYNIVDRYKERIDNDESKYPSHIVYIKDNPSEKYISLFYIINRLINDEFNYRVEDQDLIKSSFVRISRYNLGFTSVNSLDDNIIIPTQDLIKKRNVLNRSLKYQFDSSMQLQEYIESQFRLFGYDNNLYDTDIQIDENELIDSKIVQGTFGIKYISLGSIYIKKRILQQFMISYEQFKFNDLLQFIIKQINNSTKSSVVPQIIYEEDGMANLQENSIFNIKNIKHGYLIQTYTKNSINTQLSIDMKTFDSTAVALMMHRNKQRNIRDRSIYRIVPYFVGEDGKEVEDQDTLYQQSLNKHIEKLRECERELNLFLKSIENKNIINDNNVSSKLEEINNLTKAIYELTLLSDESVIISRLYHTTLSMTFQFNSLFLFGNMFTVKYLPGDPSLIQKKLYNIHSMIITDVAFTFNNNGLITTIQGVVVK